MYWLWVLVATLLLSIIVPVVFKAAMLDWHAAYQSDPGLEPSVGIAALFLLPFPLALIGAGIIRAVRYARRPATGFQRRKFNQEAATKVAELAGPEITPIDAELQRARLG